MSLNPFIFIGLGGTGGKTLGVVRQTLSDSLDRIGWRQGWPSGWQFLHIDVPADPDAKSEHIPYSLSRAQYVALTGRKSTFGNYAASVATSLRRAVPDEAQRFYAWDCWHPYPNSSVKVNIVNGAGQYRSIGRICALEQLGKIDRAVAAAVDTASSAEASPELLRVQQLLGEGNAAVTDGRPVIFVVGSVAGGSGSGMLLDVCDVLRARGHKEINAVLFTPEVFEHPDGTMDPGVAPNTFMALSELTNSMWTTAESDSPLSRNLLFSRAGVGYPVGHNGPSTVFLVGRRNGSVVFSETEDVYKIMGRSLAELALDEALTRDVIAYDVANALAVAAGGTDGLELSSPRGQARDLAVFRSMGFSRLSVGRDFFEKYAVDRISRAVTLRLLDGHLLRRQPGGNSSDDELLNNAVEDAWEPFLHASQIDECDIENDITDRLRTLDDPPVAAALRELREKSLDAMRKVAVKGRVKTTDAGRAVEQEVGLARHSILVVGLAAAGRRALEFQADIQKSLGQVTAERIADDGLPVTTALLARLIARSQQALKSLASDVEEAGRREQEALRSLSVGKVVAAAEFPLDATDQVEAILKQANRATARALQAQYHEVARVLLADLIEHLLKPWHRAVIDADGLLRLQARPANQDSVLDIWPTGDAPGEAQNVPDYLRPSKVEFLMDDVDQFPQAFHDIVEQSVSGIKGSGAAVQRAIHEVAAGTNLGKQAVTAKTPPVVNYEMDWGPEWDLAREPKKAKASAQIKLNLSLTDIRTRAHDWIWDDEKASGRYLRTTLNEYLTDRLASETERAERLNRLLGQFQAMVKASLPLLAVDPDMAQKIHGHDQPPYNLHMTALNVPRSLAPRLADIAQALLNSQQTIPTTTNPKSDAMMMTLLREPYHMMEIASIMEPIVDQWSRLSATKDFWLWRRARPLPEWVPLSPMALDDLIRGWFMARLQGVAFAGENGKSLFVEIDKKTLPVAESGVRAASSVDHVGMVVEGVATAALAAFRSRSLDPVAPYQALIALGGTFEDDDNPLLDWVKKGGKTAAKEFQQLGPDVDLTRPEGRRQAALALVDAWLDGYAADSEQFAETHQAQRHPTYELNGRIIDALEEIKDCLGKVQEGIRFR
ncbi:MAG: tubulin-like doman-containing protein [Propionibacteriaceae bacterium]|jgi:hypothetical protein|nr:tubulin-like doman-containing protein [Propionibacteriaceae bacterium]